MPAAAVASLTPATGGMSGKRAGASGEMAAAMASFLCHSRSGPRSDAESGRCNRRRRGWHPPPPALEYASARVGTTAVSEENLEKQNRASVFLRLGRIVEALDLGALAQLGDEVGLRLARQIGLDLVLHLFEFRRLLDALVLDLDDVPAELRLHRIGELSGIHLEGDIGKFGHHLIFGEVAEIAALGGTGILGLFLGQLGEIGAALELFENGLRFIFAFDQDVARAHLF